jgi:type II secretory pathway pseudopilin PulG
MKTLKARNHERGFILLAVYMAAIFICLFSTVLFARHQVAVQATERYQNRILAFNAAEAGIDSALSGLAATNSTLRGTPPTDTTPSTNLIFQTPYYSFNNTTNTFGFKITYVPGRSDLRRIDAKGCAPDCTNTSRADQTSDIAVYSRITAGSPPPSLFMYGIYAKDRISMSGNAVFDSYNSNYGAYGGSNKSTDGTMAVNSTQTGQLGLSGNAKINGNVLVGYGGGSSVVTTSGNAKVTGTRSNLPQAWSNPDTVTAPEGATAISLSVSGNNTLTLPAGTYSASSISISGNAKIVTSGVVKIYVSGSISISGNGILVTNNHPANLLLYSTGSSSVSISGNGSFYGGVYAPNSAVTTSGNGDFFGAMISKTYTQSGNGSIHYDLAMNAVPGTVDLNQTEIVRIKAWQEMNSLAWGTGQTIT